MMQEPHETVRGVSFVLQTADPYIHINGVDTL